MSSLTDADATKLWVGLRFIADEHADVLRPKQIDILYEAAAALAALPERIRVLDDVLKRIRGIARQAEVYHDDPRVGSASDLFAKIDEEARTALGDL